MSDQSKLWQEIASQGIATERTLRIRIEQLEAALRLTRPYIEMHTLSPNGTMATVLAKIDDALDNLCEDEGCPNAGTPHVCINRQENDDVYPGFRGNNEA